jgi:hypothetical protein
MPRRSGGSFALNSGGKTNVNGAGILLYFVILSKVLQSKTQSKDLTISSDELKTN